MKEGVRTKEWGISVVKEEELVRTKEWEISVDE